MSDVAIKLWLDDRKVGCGWREYVVVQRGRVWAALLYPALLVKVRVPLDALRGAEPLKTDPSVIVKRIKKTKRERDALGMQRCSDDFIRLAMAALETGATETEDDVPVTPAPASAAKPKLAVNGTVVKRALAGRIKVLVQGNPMKPGSAVHGRWAALRDGASVDDYCAAVGKHGVPDLREFVKRGYLSIE